MKPWTIWRWLATNLISNYFFTNSIRVFEILSKRYSRDNMMIELIAKKLKDWNNNLYVWSRQRFFSLFVKFFIKIFFKNFLIAIFVWLNVSIVNVYPSEIFSFHLFSSSLLESKFVESIYVWHRCRLTFHKPSLADRYHQSH